MRRQHETLGEGVDAWHGVIMRRRTGTVVSRGRTRRGAGADGQVRIEE